MSAPHEATLVFDYPDTESARLVERAVSQELDEIDGDRTRATLVRDGRTVEVRVSADDLVALRAGCNTWCTLVEVAEAAGGVVS
ncbi:KEOPS complex subunit Pcc1 [Salinirubellus salinus]|uniref:KEOPS complex subunit Pcc1 n=1 Tax=Salinirubellus salinus TaxID=1364945 RepID=A0A9E7R5F2_9EURY|nr:KEOPS complex subunit Pcc1 [Salinirubellus salinus]UWM55000.1 KEOPS complex subunit Pcc1 [Salinirubellus salinus]